VPCISRRQVSPSVGQFIELILIYKSAAKQ
jgi:hypothetical protein